MENENTGNNINTSSIVEELQILNQGTVSNGEKLDQVIEYLITKDQKDQEEKEAAQKKQQEQEEADQKNQQEEDAALKQQEEETQEQTETYTELLTDIRDQAVLNNNIMAGQIFFMGVLFGIILLNVLWNRFIR